MAGELLSTKDQNRQEFLKMYRSVTDPEEKEKAKRQTERNKRRDDKIKDTGLNP